MILMFMYLLFTYIWSSKPLNASYGNVTALSFTNSKSTEVQSDFEYLCDLYSLWIELLADW